MASRRIELGSQGCAGRLECAGPPTMLRQQLAEGLERRRRQPDTIFAAWRLCVMWLLSVMGAREPL